MPQTREKILCEATRLFSEKSYDVATVREIAAAVKVNESSIYWHYKNKEDILNEIMATFLRMVSKCLFNESQISEIIEKETPCEVLNQCFLRIPEDDIGFIIHAYRIICMEQFTNEVARNIIVNIVHEQHADYIKGLLDQLMESKKIPIYDTRFFSNLCVRVVFSESKMWLHQFSTGQDLASVIKRFYEFRERLINMALSGNIPMNKQG